MMDIVPLPSLQGRGISFCVGQPGGPVSPHWRVWLDKSDVYLKNEHLTKQSKFSFHSLKNGERASLYCVLEPHAKKRGLPGRKITKINRTATPALGEGLYKPLAAIYVPRGALSFDLPQIPIKGAEHWISSPDLGYVQVVVIALTNESEVAVRQMFDLRKGGLIAFEPLANGENCFVGNFAIPDHPQDVIGQSIDGDLSSAIIYTDKPVIGFKKEMMLTVVDDRGTEFHLYYMCGCKVPASLVKKAFPNAMGFRTDTIFDNSGRPDDWPSMADQTWPR